MQSKAFEEMFDPASLPEGDARGFIAELLETIYEGILVHEGGTILFANRRLAEMVGCASGEELLGRNALELLHPDDRPRAARRIARLMAEPGGRAEPVVYRVVREDGGIVFGEVQASRMAGARARVLVAVRDVTARHQHEQELERVQRLVDQAVDPIYAIDREGRFTLVNRALARLLGLSREELAGRRFDPFIAPEHRAFVRGEFACKIDGLKERSSYEVSVVDRDGGLHPVEINSAALRDAGGRIVGVQGVLRDLTRRRRHQERIRMLMQAMEYVAEAITITDREGRICYANRGAGALFGMEPNALIGRYAAELRGGGRDDALYREIVARVNGGDQWKGMVEIAGADGRRRNLERVVSPIPDREGNTQYHACVDRDITEQLEQQKQLEHTQRLESLGVLAGGIAHDFNNILTAILGNVSLADAKLREDPVSARAHLVRIGQSAERAATLCRQMLAYSGRGRFVTRRLDLSEEVRSMAELLEVSLKKEVGLQMELADDLPPLEADESQLQQLVMNLITNANEAIEGEGRIVLRTGCGLFDAAWLAGCVAVERIRPGRYLYLEVEDDGCGMDPATQQRIFDPFFTTKFTGRGLGMSALLGIVRGHDGYIRLDSAPGRGTRITVLLPAAGQPGKEVEARVDEAPMPLSGGGATVLVVEDEESVREAAVAMLEDAGYRALSAGDGAAGVECYRARASEIDLVLLDLTMPRMDGDAALRALQRIDPAVRVVIASGYDGSEVRDRFIERGIAGVLRKPYDQERLCTAVRQALA
ncbi:MAG: PAS domain S-box protein [Zetaproteobacteria bacterium]|nr:MAG: PAS domain S-box protein [Zetaproteobacteria bacterium]